MGTGGLHAGTLATKLAPRGLAVGAACGGTARGPVPLASSWCGGVAMWWQALVLQGVTGAARPQAHLRTVEQAFLLQCGRQALGDEARPALCGGPPDARQTPCSDASF